VTTIVVDGTWQWVYTGASNSYSKTALPPLPDGVETRPLGVGLTFVGPVRVASKRDLMDGLRESVNLEFVREAGTATVLGRETTIIEFGPASRSSTNQGNALLGGGTPGAAAQPTETSSGVVRVWLDEERMVSMRYVQSDAPQDVRAEVVRLDWDAPVPAHQLVFTPPPGATEVDDQTGLATSGHSEGGAILGDGAEGTLGFTIPPGFFTAAYLPDGFRAREYEKESDANNQPTRLTVKFAHATSDADLTVDQSRSSGPPQLRDEPMEHLLVGGVEAFLAKRAGDQGSGSEFALATRRGDMNITITAHGVSREEVIAVAEGLELVP